MINTQDVSEIIYEIRGMKVMLDSDLASLFGYETKNLNKAVKRNLSKFSGYDYFQLTNEENDALRFQIGTSKTRGGRRTNPYVFTLDGIEILTTFIHSINLSETLNTIRKAFDKPNSLISTKDLFSAVNSGNIKEMIYEINGEYIMLDSDLAMLYECKNGTKEITQNVKNNIEKFPPRYSWILSDEEYKSLSLVKNFDQRISRRGRNGNPRVFTEHGIAMLATVLHTPVASKITIAILDAFLLMSKYITSSLLNQKYINDIALESHSMALENKRNIKLLQSSITEISKRRKTNEIYFSGQIFDAYSKIKDIFSKAKKEIIIIDGYADITVLDMISSLKCDVILIVKSNAKLSMQDINKYNLQYNNLKVVFDNSYHDRYFILDRKKIYHCGASINHAGSRTFSINLLEDNMVVKAILDDVKSII